MPKEAITTITYGVICLIGAVVILVTVQPLTVAAGAGLGATVGSVVWSFCLTVFLTRLHRRTASTREELTRLRNR